MTTIPQNLIAQVKARASLVAVAGRHIKLFRSGREMVGFCPFHNGKSKSFHVCEDKGFINCFGCGFHGDAIDFAMRINGWTFRDAVRELAYDLGLTALDDRPKRPLAKPMKRLSPAEIETEKLQAELAAQATWKSCSPADDSLVAVYLKSRAITIPVPPTIRFHGHLKHSESGLVFPAMVAAVQHVGRSIKGIHRIFLSADGTRKAGVDKPKKMKGTCWGGAVRLGPVAETIIVCEGIETGMSLAQSMPGSSVWCALSLGNISGCVTQWIPHPNKLRPDGTPLPMPNDVPNLDRPGIMLPDEVKEVVIAADGDNQDPIGAANLYKAAARRFAAQGRKARIAWPPEGKDFNDVLAETAA